LIITGLIFNLIGSLFLAYHIIGVVQAKKFEQKILELPTLISFGIFGWGLFAAFRTMIKIDFKDYKWGEKYIKESNFNIKELNKLINKHSAFHGDRSLESIFGNIIKDPVKEIFFFSVALWFFYLILLSPLIAFTAGTIKLFAKIQNTFKIESLLGVIGIVLLSIGFVLQLIGNL